MTWRLGGLGICGINTPSIQTHFGQQPDELVNSYMTTIVILLCIDGTQSVAGCATGKVEPLTKVMS